MILRSLLYVPGSNPRFIEKAHTRSADAIIIDLEDAVAPGMKISARDALVDSVPQAGLGGGPVFVRINNTPELLFDDAEAACRAGAFGLYVPKVESAELLDKLTERLAPVEAELSRDPMVFVPLLETPSAVLMALPIAKADRVIAISGGAEDLATSMGAQPIPEVLSLPKQLVHLAAKAAGVQSLGLLRSIAGHTDLEGMKSAAEEARRYGFDGASCIHPSIVPVLNAAFGPSADEIAWAERVIEADEQARTEGKGAYMLGGKFIDAPIVARAQAQLALAAHIKTKTSGQTQ